MVDLRSLDQLGSRSRDLLTMKIGLVSLGCPKNLVDSEVMLGLAREAGHELTQDASQAEVLVVNTCAFIDSAKQESIDAILEMSRHKTDGVCRRLIVTGCLAERYRDELRVGSRHRIGACSQRRRTVSQSSRGRGAFDAEDREIANEHGRLDVREEGPGRGQ